MSKLLNRLFYSLTSRSSSDYIALEHEFGCHNYHPLPVVVAEANGIYVSDVEGTLISIQAKSTLTSCQHILLSIKATATRASWRHSFVKLRS